MDAVLFDGLKVIDCGSFIAAPAAAASGAWVGMGVAITTTSGGSPASTSARS